MVIRHRLAVKTCSIPTGASEETAAQASVPSPESGEQLAVRREKP